jgi:cell division protein FtsQ
MNRRRRIDSHGASRSRGASVKAGLVALLKAAGVVAITGAIGWGAFAGYRWLRTSERFALRTLTFTGTVRASQEELTRRAGLVAGTNIFAVDRAAVAEGMEQDPWVRKVRVARELPDTLHVAVDEHRAALLVECGDLCVVDEDGVPFKHLDSADGLDLPLLTGLPRELLEQGPLGPATAVVTDAIAIAAAYRRAGMEDRAPLSELHVELDAGETRWSLFCGDEPVEVALGALDRERLDETALGALEGVARVWDELERRGARASRIDGGNRQRPEWVAVRLK